MTSACSLKEAVASRTSRSVQRKQQLRVSVASMDRTSVRLVMGFVLFSFWR